MYSIKKYKNSKFSFDPELRTEGQIPNSTARFTPTPQQGVMARLSLWVRKEYRKYLIFAGQSFITRRHKKATPRLVWGFTILEIVIVVAVSVFILVAGLSAFSQFNKNQALRGAAAEAISVLDKGRSLTLGARDNIEYGVHFEADKIVLFKGATYSSSDTSNKVTKMNPLVTISDISLTGGGSDVIFNRLSGETVQGGTVTISLVSNASITKTIIIHPTGVVELVGSAPSPSSIVLEDNFNRGTGLVVGGPTPGPGGVWTEVENIPDGWDVELDNNRIRLDPLIRGEFI